MKHMKKLLSLAMALAMVMALGVSASAATSFKGVEGHTYSVYTIFTASTADDGSLKNFVWGSNIVPATFIRNLQTLTIGSGEYAAFNSHFAGLTAESSADDVALAISNAKAGNNDASVAALVSAAAKDAREGVPSDLTKDYGPGYYLLEDTTPGVTGANYAVYEINGNTPNTLQITDKTDTPSPEKRVHANDSESVKIDSDSWGYAADYRVGDYVPYKLSTVVTDKYTTADVYTVTFRDKMDDGLTFVNTAEYPFKVYIVSADGTETEVASSAYELLAPTANATFALTINLKSDSLKNIIAAGDSVVVTYYAQLNENAVLGDVNGGNKNHVDLDWTVDDESGTTPGDDVTVFTFQLVADKVDGNGKPLSGAEFKLEKLINGVWTPVDKADVGDADDGTEGTKFTFNTLDSGIYRLVETQVPTGGYNKADDFYFEVAPEYNANQANTTLNLKIYAVSTTDEGATVTRGAEITEGILLNHSGYNTQVVNNQGLTLPSTGGIGTTIFYIVGGLLAAGAVILLITKRRMNLSED